MHLWLMLWELSRRSIKDGRIQLVDVYGQGNLVLLDGGDPIDQNPNEKDPQDDTYTGKTPVNTYTTEGGFRHYRLFISDTELRGMNYLTVYPNTALTNSTFSFALETHWGTGTKTTEGWVSDAENIRAPYSSNEKYFEFEYDDLDTSDANSGGAAGVYIIPKAERCLLSEQRFICYPRFWKGVMRRTSFCDANGSTGYSFISYNIWRITFRGMLNDWRKKCNE